MINANTQLVGLIGHPVSHSFSPLIHNAVFEHLGMNWCYLPLDVHPRHLQEAVTGLSALGYRGVNVTAPHKETILPYLDTVDQHAAEVGAVNTLVFQNMENGQIIIKGFNTDEYGFIKSLKEEGFDFLSAKKVVIVGAGGAAKAVIMGLIHSGTTQITILCRDVEKGRASISRMKLGNKTADILQVTPYTPQTLNELSQSMDLLVNATPIGTAPAENQSIYPDEGVMPKNLVVFDLVYNPIKTKLIRQVESSGAHAIGGLNMLIYQAARSFELWTGIFPPIEVMKSTFSNMKRGDNA